MLPIMMTSPHSLYSSHPLGMMHGLRTTPWLYNELAMHDAAASWRRARTMEKAMAKAFRLHERAVENAWRQLHERPAATWQALNEHEAEISLQLPDGLSEDSLSASLSEDGRSLKLTGTSGACACEEIVLTEIALPYGHANAKDVQLLLKDDGVLTVRASKSKPALELKILKASPPPEERATLAPARDAKAEEKELENKFKIAIDSVATQAAVVEKMGQEAAIADEAPKAPHEAASTSDALPADPAATTEEKDAH